MSCEHVINKNKKNQRNCKNKAVKGGYCNKHAKRSEIDLNKDEVFATKQKVVEVSADKTKYSVFRWTLNSNKDFEKMTKEEKQNFKNFTEFIFDKERVQNILQDKSNPDPQKNIEKIDSEFYYEVGTRFGRLHAHGVIRLEHTGFYQIASSDFQKLAEKALGSKIHFNVQASGNPDAAWSAYIQKKQNSKVVEL